mgnify:CR=1 FL=1
MRELNVVISGFDHYDGVEVNPAVEVPKAIAEQGLGVSSAPVSYTHLTLPTNSLV